MLAAPKVFPLGGSSGVQISILTGVYLAAASFGLEMEAVAGFASLVWAPTGIALAALLLFGYRLWPGVTIGAFLANLIAGAPALVALGIATGNTLEAVLGALALRRIPGFQVSLGRLRDVLGLIFLAAVLSTAVSATIGVGTLHLGGLVPPSAFGETWLAWWLGDLVGAMIVAPVLLVWSAGGVPIRNATPGEILEAAALAALTAAVSLFLQTSMGALGDAYLYFLPLIWAALRFGQVGVASTLFVVMAIALTETVLGQGPFVRDTVGQSLFAVQAFIAITAPTFLVLGAISAERRRSLAALRKSERELEQRVAERTEALSHANALLSQAQEIAHIGTFAWEIGPNVVTWSDELYRIYGLRPRELEASYEAFLERIHPEDRAHVDAAIREAASSSGTFELDERIVRPDGAIRILHSQGRSIADRGGKPTRVVGLCQDVTEQKRAQEALRDTNVLLEARVRERTAELTLAHEAEQKARASAEDAVRARDAFLSIASHELRSPLGVIHLTVELLKAGGTVFSTPEGSGQLAEKLGRQVERLNRLIANLLDVSRITSGKLEIDIQDVDLASVVRDVLARFDDDLRHAKCPVALHADAPVVGRWDGMRIEQIVTNLLSNAIKYGPGKPIEIRVESDRDSGRIVIRDGGIGIAQENQARIFERFERVPSTTRMTGLGLGLWIVREIVDAFGGTIQVASAPNEGATFTVELPRGTIAIAEGREVAQFGEILVVEDDSDALESLTELLRSRRYSVAGATNGQEALDYLGRSRSPCVILLDLRMPIMDGVQFLRVKEQEPKLAPIPVVLLSADGQLAEKAQSLPVAGYLAKPVDFDRLLAEVARLCPRPPEDRLARP